MAARCRREVGGVPACPHVRGGGRPRSVTEPRFDHCSLHLGSRAKSRSRAEQDVARAPSVAAAAERPWIGATIVKYASEKTIAIAFALPFQGPRPTAVTKVLRLMIAQR